MHVVSFIRFHAKRRKRGARCQKYEILLKGWPVLKENHFAFFMEKKIRISKVFVFKKIIKKKRQSPHVKAWNYKTLSCQKQIYFPACVFLQVNFTAIRPPPKDHLPSSRVVPACTREAGDGRSSSTDVCLSEVAFTFTRCGYLRIIYSI